MGNVEVVMDEKTRLARHKLDRKLIKFSWALLFILIGGSWILENIGVLNNTEKWALIYAGSGGILLLLNLLRVSWNLPLSRFTVGIGVLGVLLGVGKYFDLGNISIWAAAVLVIGVFMLFEVLKK